MLDPKKIAQQQQFQERQRASAKKYRDKQKLNKININKETKVIKVKKHKKKGRNNIIKKLDAIFSQYIRLVSANDDGMATCVTCGEMRFWKQMQNGHFISRKNYKYRWDEKNCHVQCYVCNILKKGNYMFYTRFMQRKLGELLVDEMMEDKGLIKISTPTLVQRIDKYTAIVKRLKNKYKNQEKSLDFGK